MGAAYYAIKVAISAVLVVAVAELAKRSTLLGGLLASLPLISLLAMVWLYVDTGDVERVSRFAHGIFWLVLPSLLLFLALPWLLNKGLGFYPSLALAAALTALGYQLVVWLLRRFGDTL